MVRRGGGRGRRRGSLYRQTRVVVEFFWLSIVELRLWLLERWKTEEGGIEIHLGNKTVNCLQPE